jgi:hypothetical protein
MFNDQYFMKNNTLYVIVIFLLLNSEVANACCYSNEYYMVVNVAKNDGLNVRKEPHPLSPVLETLNHNQRYFLLQSYGDKNEEMYRHNLCVTVNYSPFDGRGAISTWCQLQEPKGWVNMYYLSSCEIETSDGGYVTSTKCSDVIKGKRASDYLFRHKKIKK